MVNGLELWFRGLERRRGSCGLGMAPGGRLLVKLEPALYGQAKTRAFLVYGGHVSRSRARPLTFRGEHDGRRKD